MGRTLINSGGSSGAQVSHFYLVCETDDRIVQALKDGRLSVYGAFDKPSFWIIAVDDVFRVKWYWNCLKEDVPSRFFAKPGYGLFHWHSTVPDSMEQATSMLSIKFRGADLTEQGIPFGTFKELMDQAFEAVRKLLTPVPLQNKRTSTFDFEIAPPKFASLVISVKEPVFNMTAIRRAKALKNTSREHLEQAVSSLSADFASKIVDLKERADLDMLDQSYAAENFTFLDILSDLIPAINSDIDSVELTAFGKDGIQTAVFDQKLGSEIKRQLAIAQAHEVTDHGVIVGITAQSGTILVQSVRGKVVTCKFDREKFDQLLAAESFKINLPVKIRGNFLKRQRRDYMEVQEIYFINLASYGLFE